MSKPTVKPLDILIILAVLSAGIFLTFRSGSKKASVIFVNANGTQYEYDATKDGIYTVQGELGPTTFEITNARVRILDSTCPNKTCVSQGWSSPIVCLPNKVIITAEKNNGEFDAFSE